MIKQVLIYSLAVMGLACGSDGSPGEPGPVGESGKSCFVRQIEDGAIIVCPDGTSAVIKNGTRCRKGNDED